VRLRIAIVGCGTALLACGVAAFAGSVQARPGDSAPQNLRIAGTAPDRLSPGTTSDFLVSVTNPNAFAVTVTDVVADGRVRSDRGAACMRTGVTFTDRHGLAVRLAAGATTTLKLPGAAAMSNDSEHGCQGAAFSIPISVSAIA
jgi:hypothetical protein